MKQNLCTSRITSSHHYKQGRILALSFPGHWKQLLKFCDALEKDVSIPIRIKSIDTFQHGRGNFGRVDEGRKLICPFLNLEKKETKTKIWVPIQDFELYKLVPKFYITEYKNSVIHVCSSCGAYKANKGQFICSNCAWFNSLDQLLHAEELKEQYKKEVPGLITR